MLANRALVVDDSRVARLSMKKALERCNLQVDCAESAEAALDRLGAAADALPGVIFMDNVMPGMDGLTALRRIRERWSDIPVIMCTGSAGDDYMREARAAGASGVIPKPTSVELMGQLVARLAGGVSADAWLTGGGEAPGMDARPAPTAAESAAAPAPAVDVTADLAERCATIESRGDVLAAEQADLRATVSELGAQLAALQARSGQDMAALVQRVEALESANASLLARVNAAEERAATVIADLARLEQRSAELPPELRAQTTAAIDAAAEDLHTRIAADLQALLLPQFGEQIQSALGQLEQRLGNRAPDLASLQARAVEAAEAAAAVVAEQQARAAAEAVVTESVADLSELRNEIDTKVRRAGSGRASVILSWLALAGAAAAGLAVFGG